MKTKTLLTVSALAMMVSLPALADDNAAVSQKTHNEVRAESATSGNMGEDAKRAWKDVKEDSKEAYNTAKTETQEAYEDIKATVIGAKNDADADYMINSQFTADGMLGSAVVNQADERVGTVKDIILNENGDASMVIVADFEVPGFDGKLAAFDYDLVTRQNEDGDVIMPLTEEMIDQATEFSYEADAKGDNLSIMPATGYSVAEILDADVLNPQNETVGEIENVAFNNGAASQIIVSFDEIMGMGGERAALGFSDAPIVRDGDDLDFKLSANQAAQFESYKKNTAKN